MQTAGHVNMRKKRVEVFISPEQNLSSIIWLKRVLMPGGSEQWAMAACIL
jgi:hypothetical protein